MLAALSQATWAKLLIMALESINCQAHSMFYEEMLTHCEILPAWEMVTMILSEKWIAVTSVCVPLTFPEACLDRVGNGSD